MDSMCHEQCYNTNNNNNDGISINLNEPCSVVNLSCVTLSSDQTSLLSKGLNFCPTPGEPDFRETRADVDKLHLQMRRKLFFLELNDDLTNPDSSQTTPLGTQVSNTDLSNLPFSHTKFKSPSRWNPQGNTALETFINTNEIVLNRCKTYAPRHQNLTQGEKVALKQLKQAHNIVIKPADKGSAVVILNKIDYIREGLKQLEDARFYKETTENLTDTHKLEIDTFVKNLHYKSEIDKKCCEYLTSNNKRTSQLYLLPKIHKQQRPPPGRPIVSANSSPTERISQFVDHFINPLVKLTKSFIQDTTDFLNRLQEVGPLPENCYLVTLDVTSLYTNIPNYEGMRAVTKALSKHRKGKNNPSNTSIIQLLKMALTKNNFQFNGKNYLQIGGTAMGMRAAPSFANLFMADFEEQYVYTYHLQPLLWVRFIDDIFMIWQHSLEELLSFQTYLNGVHNTIKFTMEHSQSDIAFLDTSVQIRDGKLCTTLYTKPTDAHNYLLYNSAHPPHCLQGIPLSQFLRVRRICTHIEDFDTNALTLCKHFLKRGYPITLLENALIQARRHDRDLLLAPKEQQKQVSENMLFLITTYNPGFHMPKRVIQGHLPLLNRHKSTKPLFQMKYIFGNRRCMNLRDHLVKAKLPPQESNNTLSIENKPDKPERGCKTKNCRYCPKLNTDGTITSTFTRRTYVAKHNITCKSHNIIYCITCTKCKLQYVGQTKRRLMDRFQGHFYNINKKKTDDPIGYHFNTKGHSGTDNVEIHIVDFITAPSNTDAGAKLRDLLERKWIHRLRTLTPLGLNYMD